MNILEKEDLLSGYKFISNKVLMTLDERKWFPIYENSILASEGAYFVGKIIGDGHLDLNYVTKFIGQKQNLLKIQKLINEKFKIPKYKTSIKKKYAKGISYCLQVNDCLFGRLLHSLGAPMGNKTKTSFSVPSWIYKSNVFKKRFLQAVLEDELATIKIKKLNYANTPVFKMSKTEHLLPDIISFFNQLKSLIHSFDVECSHIPLPIHKYIQNDGTKTYECLFWIQGNKKNIIRFKENIGFRTDLQKIKNLNECYNILKETL